MKRLKEMKKPCIRILSLMLMVIVAMALVAQPALAAKQPDNPLPGSKIEQQYTQAIDKLQRYLSISETGNIVLNAPKGVVKSINSEVYQTLLAGLEQTNWMIDSGYVVCNPDFTLTYTEEYLEACSQYLEPGSELVAEGNAVVLSSPSAGINGFYSYWWGYWIYLSDATCDALVIAMEAGGGISTIIAGIFPPSMPVTIIITGVLLVGVAAIHAFNTNNTGIKIRLNKTFLPFPLPPVVLTYIGAQ
jgi:hypothetical protein